MKISKYKAIDFFCGGGGMTCGLRQAGINVIAGIDIDKDAKETYEYNNPGSVFVNADIKYLRKDYFEQRFGVRSDDDSLILVGCSPCQFYSIINTDKNKSLSSKDLLKNFAEFIEYYMYNPQIQISAESGTKRSIFRQKNKTKRSKKRLHTTLIKPEQKVNEDLCSGFIVS